MSFVSNFLGLKAGAAVAALKQTAIEFDPKTASAAQIQTVADALRTVNGRLSELQINVESGQKKVEADEAEIHRNMDAASILSQQGHDDKAAPLLDTIEKTLNPRLDADKQDLADINQTIAEFERRRDDLQNKLASAKSRTDIAQRDLQRANLQVERAHEVEEQAKKDAGLLQATSDLDVASDAMEKAAKEARIKAETAMRNAKSLGGMAGPEKSTDPVVAAAFAQASGKGEKSNLTVAERLAAMKAKAAA